jgi:hypothetical protein
MRIFLATGQKLLREHVDYSSRATADRRYLLCLTKNSDASASLGIPTGKCELESGNWYGRIFHTKNSMALHGSKQKQAAYLVALGYQIEEIVQKLYNNQGPRAMHNAYALRNAICGRFQSKGLLPDGSDCRFNTVRSVIMENIHVVRPEIISLYPDIRPDPDIRMI